MTYNICQNILFLAAIFKFKINGNDLFLNPIHIPVEQTRRPDHLSFT